MFGSRSIHNIMKIFQEMTNMSAMVIARSLTEIQYCLEIDIY